MQSLAFADDLCLIGRLRGEIEGMLQFANLFFNWAGLEVNPAKCWALDD